MPANKKSDTTKPLKLVSPFGGEAALFKWPLEQNDGGNEIVEIMKSVCEDYPELALPIKNHIIKDFDPTNYESVKSCCDKFNRAIAQINLLFSGTYRPGKHRANPSRKLLKHIIQLSYNRAVDDPEKLNEYEPFSPQVYGETSFDLICKMLDDVPVKETDTFIDLGSGVGQVVLQVAALTNCKMCYGIEKSQICVEYSTKLEKEFRFWMNWYGKVFTDFELIKGDFLDKNYAQIITNCSFIFVNNFAFGPNVDHQLKLRFQNLHDGTRIVASKAFAPIKFRASGRNMSDIASIMRVSELATLKGSVSWTENPVSYYLHVIDTTLLESFFEQQKMKSSSRSGSEDTGSEKTDSCESNTGGRSDVESPPISITAADIVETTEQSTSANTTSQTTTTAATSKKASTASQSAKISRKYPRRSSRKSILNSVRNTANDSSSSTSSGNDKKVLAQYAEAASKQPSTSAVSPVTTSTRGGAHGRRKPTRKSANAVSPSSETGSKSGTSPSAAKHRKMSPRGGGGPTATETGLELLHSQALMSTKGELSDFAASSESYSPRRDQSNPRSTTYKELKVRVEDLESLPTPAHSSGAASRPQKSEEAAHTEEPYVPGLDEFMANMRNKYVEFVQQLQSPQYAAMLQQKIQEERERGQMLRGKIEEMKEDIRELEKDFVQLLHCRLKELGIDAKSPVEFVEKAKSIISVHETLRMRTREEQELYNREYEMLQRNIEARKAEYEEIAIKLQREQGTILPPFDVNLILNLKQTNQPITNARLIAQQQQSQQRSSDTPGSADISPRGPAGYPSVELIKRGDVIDLDTLIATQLQHNAGNGNESNQTLYRLPNSLSGSGNSGSGAPVNVSMCRGCGGVAAQKNIQVSPSTGFCVECESSTGSPSKGMSSASNRASPRTHQLLQRSLETALSNSGRLQAVTDELGGMGVGASGRAGSCFSIDSLVSPRLHQTVDSQLAASSGAQHSDHAGSQPSSFCLPLSATLSSPILRAGLTNPPIQQKTMGDLEKSEDRVSSLQAHEVMTGKQRYQVSPISGSPSTAGSGSSSRGAKQALAFAKFEDYNKKRGTWDLSPLHPKTLPFSDPETISQLVEKVAISTCTLTAEEQEDLCYKCILIGHLPAELRPYWEDPRSQGGDYGTPAKVQAMTASHPTTATSGFASNANSATSSSGSFVSSPLSSASIVAQAVQSLTASQYVGGSGNSSGSVGGTKNLGSQSMSGQASGLQGLARTISMVPPVASSSVAGVVSQFQSERMASESQERINSVISQVLRSSTQPMEGSSAAAFMQSVPVPETVEEAMESIPVADPLPIATTAVEIRKTMSQEQHSDVSIYAHQRPTGEAMPVEAVSEVVSHIGWKEASLKDGKTEAVKLEKDVKTEEDTKAVDKKDPNQDEDDLDDERRSQVSSQDASTIAGERELEVANVSVASSVNEEQIVDVTLSQPESSEDDSAVEGNCQNKMKESRQQKEAVDIDRTEIVKGHETEAMDDVADIGCQERDRVISDDSKSALVEQSQEQKDGSQEESMEASADKSVDVKGMDAKIVDKKDDTHRKVSVRNEGAKSPVAITKKDVAKQFHSLAMEQCNNAQKKFSVQSDGLGQSAAISSTAPALVVGKEELEVRSEELPADLLTESPKIEEESGQNEDQREKQEDKDEKNEDSMGKEISAQKKSVGAESSWLVASLNRVPTEDVDIGNLASKNNKDTEMGEEEAVSAEAEEEEESKGMSQSVDKEEREAKEAESDERARGEDVPSAATTSFDFSQINFDKTDFMEDEEKK